MNEVKDKIADMQKYIPCLKLLIENLKKNPEKEMQVEKMQYLLEMLLKNDATIKLETLVRCEGILMKVHGREQLIASKHESNDDGKEAGGTQKSQTKEVEKPSDDSNRACLVNGNGSDSFPKIVSVIGNDSEAILGNIHQENIASTSRQEIPQVVEKVDGNTPLVSHNSSKVLNESNTQVNSGSERNVPINVIGTRIAESQNVETSRDVIAESTSPEKQTNSDDCDMDIDEELTNANISSTIDNIPPLAPIQENVKTPVTTPRILNKAATGNSKTFKSSSGKSTVVDLTSDDSNDGTSPSTPQTPRTSQKNLLTTPANVNRSESVTCKKIAKGPTTVYAKQKESIGKSSTPKSAPSITTTLKFTIPKINSVAKDPLAVDKEPQNKVTPSPKPSKIMTIDLLDSDSDDEGKSSKNTLPVKSNKTNSNGQVTMPTPKLDKPMFTIASVQSINTLQAHQEKRREVEQQLYGIVKHIQATKHHTVPLKYNETVRNYLQNFVKELMFEKNRVNLCLQKLQKTLDLDKYKQVKRIIQSYCSEPVNDDSMPAPSPFCHRIKVYPEKLQFVMRQLFFFNAGISVVGYKVYSLTNNVSSLNGLTKSPLKDTSPMVAKPAIMAQSATAITTSPISKNQLSPSNNPQTGMQKSQLPSFASIRQKQTPSPALSNDDLLAPMKTQTIAPSQPTPKPRRRRRHSDDDDDADENYVPQGYFSDPDDDVPDNPTETPRRTSLQRASKVRCQKYLELERTIDDETYIRATEASIERALKGGSTKSSNCSSSDQPPAKKAKPMSRPKKKYTQLRPVPQPEEDTQITNPDIEENGEKNDLDDSDEGPLTKRRKKNQPSDQEMDLEEEDDEDDGPVPNTDVPIENNCKNVVRAFHCRSKYMNKCLICHEKSNKKRIISHYVANHRDREIYVSRITKSDILKLQSETMCFAFQSSSKGTISTYVAYCIFCQREQTLSLKNWYEHYTRHTGEFGYECSKCKVRRSCRQQINRHVRAECAQSGPNVVVLDEIHPDATRIDAFVCLLCNYIQLKFESLFKHLQTEHEFPGTVLELPEGTYQNVNLLKIEQNYYESIGTGEDGAEAIGETPIMDDMSFMICNMLATGQEQTNEMMQTSVENVEMFDTVAEENNVIAALPGSQNELAIDVVMENRSGARPETPEMIIPECIPSISFKEVDRGTSKHEATKNHSKKSSLTDLVVAKLDPKQDHETKCDAKTQVKDVDYSSETKEETTVACIRRQTEKETKEEKGCENEREDNKSVINCEVVNVSDVEKSVACPINTLADMDPLSLLDRREIDVSDSSVVNEVESTKQPSTSIIELDSCDTSQSASLIDDEGNKELTQSAIETILQRVSDSLIESAYEAVEDLPETNLISSDSTSDLLESAADSMESEPQFLAATEEPSDPVLAVVTEIVSPELDDTDMIECESQQVESILPDDDIDDLIADANQLADLNELISEVADRFVTEEASQLLEAEQRIGIRVDEPAQSNSFDNPLEICGNSEKRCDQADGIIPDVNEDDDGLLNFENEDLLAAESPESIIPELRVTDDELSNLDDEDVIETVPSSKTDFSPRHTESTAEEGSFSKIPKQAPLEPSDEPAQSTGLTEVVASKSSDEPASSSKNDEPISIELAAEPILKNSGTETSEMVGEQFSSSKNVEGATLHSTVELASNELRVEPMSSAKSETSGDPAPLNAGVELVSSPKCGDLAESKLSLESMSSPKIEETARSETTSLLQADNSLTSDPCLKTTLSINAEGTVEREINDADADLATEQSTSTEIEMKTIENICQT